MVILLLWRSLERGSGHLPLSHLRYSGIWPWILYSECFLLVHSNFKNIPFPQMWNQIIFVQDYIANSNSIWTFWRQSIGLFQHSTLLLCQIPPTGALRGSVLISPDVLVRPETRRCHATGLDAAAAADLTAGVALKATGRLCPVHVPQQTALAHSAAALDTRWPEWCLCHSRERYQIM